MLSQFKWLTLLSLDAPLVAVAWQALYAREQSITLAWYHRLIVFTSVWLGYAADRWFDNRKQKRPDSAQHQFFAKYSRQVVTIWILVLASSISLALTRLTNDELTHGFLLAGASFAYTLFAQHARSLTSYPILKSLFTALLILESALLFIPAYAIPPLASFAIWSLFTSNCLFIRAWKHKSENRSARQATLLALTNTIACVFLIWTQGSSLAAASLLAQAGVVLLHLTRGKTETSTRRTVIDLCLLTPLLLLLF